MLPNCQVMIADLHNKSIGNVKNLVANFFGFSCALLSRFPTLSDAIIKATKVTSCIRT